MSSPLLPPPALTDETDKQPAASASSHTEHRLHDANYLSTQY